MLRPNNVRHRLTLRYVTVFAALLMLFICGATLLQYLQLRRQIFHAEIQDVETVEGLLDFSPQGQLELHEDYHNHPQHRLLLDRYMEVLSPDGRVLLRNEKLRGQGLGGTPFHGEGVLTYNERVVPLSDKTRVLVISHLHSIGKVPLLIRLGYSAAPLWLGVKGFLLLLLLAMPFALVIAGFAAYRMAFDALRPVADMASRAATITASDLAKRLDVDNPADEFGHLAAVFNAMLQRLEDSFENLKRFTADASHELRTPLASIRSVGEVGLRRSHSPDEYRDIIGSMLEEVNRLTLMVEGLLQLARADAGRAPMQITTFSAVQMVREVVELLAMLAEEKQQRIFIEGDCEIVLNADRIVLHHAIGNILENAIKYSPASTDIYVRVLKASEGDTDSIYIEIEDQGYPIAENLSAQIFERFFRIDESRSRDKGGAGLGLAIAKEAVLAHRGAISLKHMPTGNRFVIQLPAF